MPARNTLRQPFQLPAQNTERLAEILSAVLASVDGARIVKTDTFFTVSATTNTWSRGARRKHKQSTEAVPAAEAPSELNLVCRVAWIYQEGATFLECQWMKGKDRPLFEAFASHVSRKVTAATKLPASKDGSVSAPSQHVTQVAN
jgi:hypothetical protein